MNVLESVRELFRRFAILTDYGEEYASLVRPAQDAKFGDYQANLRAMSLKQKLQRPPREIAQQIVDALPDPSLFESIEIAGPGFINLRLADAIITQELSAKLQDERLGLPVTEPSERSLSTILRRMSPSRCMSGTCSTIIGD